MDAYAKATRVVAITLLLFVEPLSAADGDAFRERSYETGQIGLAELLEVRRLTLEIRREHLARRLEAALAGVELAAAAGVLR